jgi:hypothetical protein
MAPGRMPGAVRERAAPAYGRRQGREHRDEPDQPDQAEIREHLHILVVDVKRDATQAVTGTSAPTPSTASAHRSRSAGPVRRSTARTATSPPSMAAAPTASRYAAARPLRISAHSPSAAQDTATGQVSTVDHPAVRSARTSATAANKVTRTRPGR